MIGFRPCGACRAYVPAAYGCGHWRPGNKPEPPRKGKGEASRRRKVERDREYHRNISDQQRAAKRERDRTYARAARARAKEDVGAFRAEQKK